MPEIIHTITIQHPDVEGATMIINESDFDPAVHKRPGDVPADGDQQSADARTLRTSQPGPEDDARVSAAASRLRRSGANKPEQPAQ